MLNKRTNITFSKIVLFLEIAVLLFFLFWHLKLGLVRFFDADEFAHLHWGYSFSIGERPYTDFFYLFPPLFLYPVAAIFNVFGRSIQAIIATRIFIFFIFLATSGVLFLIAKKLRGVNFALLTVIFFAFLPLPFDKLIEVRPDLVATFLALLGIWLFMKGNKGDRGKQKYFFLSGLAYAASVGVVPKTVFFLVPVGVVMVYRWLMGDKGNKGDRGNRGKEVRYFGAGFLGMFLLLLTLFTSYGNFSFALYSITRMASEVTKVLGNKFYMRPDIFFYPNDTFYGFAGWSVPLWVNLFIWVTASVWAIHRMLSFNLEGDKGNKGDGGRAEFLVVGSLWANLAAFVYFYPLKHSQYLIPVAPFIAYYFADLWGAVVNKLPKSVKLLRMGATVILLLFFSVVGFQMNQKKEQWVNKPTIDKVNYFLTTIPKDTAVFDLTGESVFFKNGYYFCCLPYGQYEEALYFKYPDIEKDLNVRQTQYVHLGWPQRLGEIPARHAKYISENYKAASPDKLLLIKKDSALMTPNP